MRNPSTQGMILFIIICVFLLLLLVSFISIIIYKYQQKQNAHYKKIEELKLSHENILLQSQLEIQEQTFEHISQEIHDNIGQKLTLAKLHLNTLDFSARDGLEQQVNNSVRIIGEAISDLSDISRSMSPEIILNNGFVKALEYEVNQLNKPGIYNIRLSVTGEPVFMEAQKELLLFRIVQESLNNIVKHANASNINIILHFTDHALKLEVTDNGKGFNPEQHQQGNGLGNIAKRASLLNGHYGVRSCPGEGTSITIKIPLYEQQKV